MSARQFLAAARIQWLIDPSDTHPGKKMPPATKWALAAIADDASDKTNLSFPGLAKVMVWANVGDRRALELIADLVEHGWLERIKTGFPGQRAVYKVNLPDWAFAPEGDPTPVENPQNGPVDKSEKMGARSRTQPEMGELKREKVRDLAPLSVKPLRINTQSHTQPHLDATPVVENDDQASTPRAGWRTRRAERRSHKRASSELDLTQLAALVGDRFTAVGIDPDDLTPVLQQLATRVIAKGLEAGTRIQNPTSYVAASIDNDLPMWQRVALELDVIFGSRHQA